LALKAGWVKYTKSPCFELLYFGLRHSTRIPIPKLYHRYPRYGSTGERCCLGRSVSKSEVLSSKIWRNYWLSLWDQSVCTWSRV